LVHGGEKKMNLLSVYIAWVFIMIIEVFWLMNDISAGGGNKETIYVIMIISLAVGITGLNLYNKNVK
jgi:hypothetical protein